MADSFAVLIIGEGDSATVTPLTEEQYNDFLQNGMDYDMTDPSTGQLRSFRIKFIPMHVIQSGHYPPNPCTPVNLFMTRQVFQGCASGPAPLQ
jgi:hypothetical protein